MNRSSLSNYHWLLSSLNIIINDQLIIIIEYYHICTLWPTSLSCPEVNIFSDIIIDMCYLTFSNIAFSFESIPRTCSYTHMLEYWIGVVFFLTFPQTWFMSGMFWEDCLQAGRVCQRHSRWHKVKVILVIECESNDGHRKWKYFGNRKWKYFGYRKWWMKVKVS